MGVMHLNLETVIQCQQLLDVINNSDSSIQWYLNGDPVTLSFISPDTTNRRLTVTELVTYNNYVIIDTEEPIDDNDQ